MDTLHPLYHLVIPTDVEVKQLSKQTKELEDG